MRIERVHFSDGPLDAVEGRVQPDPTDFSVPRGAHKPLGLWYSVEHDDGHGWVDRCRAEQWGNTDPLFGHVLVLDVSRILRLADARDILRFGQQYGCEAYPGARLTTIDWRPVARDFAGIEIWPYQWECRLDFDCSWYYGWDCASGCVWDATAVLGIQTRALRSLQAVEPEPPASGATEERTP